MSISQAWHKLLFLDESNDENLSWPYRMYCRKYWRRKPRPMIAPTFDSYWADYSGDPGRVNYHRMLRKAAWVHLAFELAIALAGLGWWLLKAALFAVIAVNLFPVISSLWS